MTVGENRNYDEPKSYSGSFNTITKADYPQFKKILHYSDLVSSSKVRSCYRVSIPSKPSSQKKIIRSKNNNKIAGKWDC